MNRKIDYSINHGNQTVLIDTSFMAIAHYTTQHDNTTPDKKIVESAGSTTRQDKNRAWS